MRSAFICAIIILSITHSGSANESSDPKLIGWWKLQNDCNDYSGGNNHGINHNVDFNNGNYADFNGTNAYIEIPDNDNLDMGSGDFSISVKVKCKPNAGVTGDLIRKFNSGTRQGINFGITASSPGYSSVSDTRNLFFGTDNGIIGEWTDCGRIIPDNALISILITYKNHLYAGIADSADPVKTCRMFRYEDDGKWTDCGRVSQDINTPSVYSTVIHNGALYVGTGKWDYGNLATGGEAGVFRYKGGKNWEECGKFSKGKRIVSLASYNGTLFASDDTGSTYRYNGAESWTYTGSSSSYKFLSTMVYKNNLYGGASTTIERYNNNSAWEITGRFDESKISQVHTFCVYEGNLYAGTWPDGLIMRYDSDGNWTECGWTGVDEKTELAPGLISRINEINNLTVYNGKMYAGVIPKGEVWRYDGGDKTTLIKNLVNNTDYKVNAHDSWCRVPCMAIYRGELFAGTSSARGFAIENQTIDTGKVFRWKTGECLSFDDDLGTGWRHITITRSNGILKMYIDGVKTAESSENTKSINVSNNESLYIGFGAENYFNGSIKDVQIYRGALSEPKIKDIYNSIK